MSSRFPIFLLTNSRPNNSTHISLKNISILLLITECYARFLPTNSLHISSSQISYLPTILTWLFSMNFCTGCPKINTGKYTLPSMRSTIEHGCHQSLKYSSSPVLTVGMSIAIGRPTRAISLTNRVENCAKNREGDHWCWNWYNFTFYLGLGTFAGLYCFKIFSLAAHNISQNMNEKEKAKHLLM